jgi:hypothetical protein
VTTCNQQTLCGHDRRGLATHTVLHAHTHAHAQGAPFPEATLKLWLCQMLLALEYLQVQKVLHRCG